MFLLRKRMAFLAFLTSFVTTQLNAATAVSWPPIGGTAYSVPAAGESGWANLSLYLIALQNAQGTTSQKTATRVATTTPVTVVSASDAVVVSNMAVASAVTVNLPAGVTGQYFAIVDGKGDAATNNITIDANLSQTINGALTYVINKNRAGIILSWTGSEWTVIGEYSNIAGTGATPNATANTIASRNSLAQSFFDGVGHSSLNSAPSYVEGLMWYDNVDETMRYYNDSSTDSVNIGQELNVKVRNTSGSTINAGQVVRITGAVSGVPTVSLAQANAFATSKVFAVVTESISNNSNGYATVAGLVKNLNLSAFADGDVLFLSSSVAGGLTATRPSAPNYAIAIGNVASNSSTTGRLIVQMTAARPIGFGTGNQVLGMNNGGTEQEYKTITGTADEIDITNGANSITIGLNSAQEFPSQTGNSGKFLTTNGTAVSWSAVSGADSQGVNYIGNGNFENSSNGVQPTGWQGFTDAAASTPANGTGGTNPPTGVTFLASTTSPLRGVLSAVLTKDAANRQGAGYSYDFTISSVDVSKKFQASLDMSVNSGTYAAGDVTVYLYDVTNSTLLTPQTVQLPSATTSFVTTVDTTTSTSYRWIVYVSSTSASAYSLKFDSMYVGPSVVYNGATISEWQTFTPTGSWTNTTYTGRYRRVGTDMEILLDGVLTGTPAAGDLTFTLPFNYTINTAAMTSNAQNINHFYMGTGSIRRSGVTTYHLRPRWQSTTTLRFDAFTASTSFAEASTLTASNPASFVSGDFFTLRMVVPIAEWAGSGTVNIGPGAQEEYAWNSDNSATASVTASGFANGPQGVTFGAGWGTGTTFTRRVRFQYPIQTGDLIVLEFLQNGAWKPLNEDLGSLNTQNTTIYGARVSAVSGTTTDMDVIFGNGGYSGGITFAAAGNAWSTQSANSWRVRKVKASSPVGFGMASATASGLVSYEDSGSFTVYLKQGSTAGNAASTGQSGTVYYSRVGKSVTLQIPALSNTNTGTAQFLSTSDTTGVNTWPAGLTPVTTQAAFLGNSLNGSTGAAAFHSISTAGVYQFFLDANGNAFGAGSGVKGVLTSNVTYRVN